MRPTDRYAMRDARIRESRQNEARILLYDEIQGYRDRIAELEKELAELKTAKEPEAATAPEAEKSPATASAQETTPSSSAKPEAATPAARAKSKGKK